MNFRELLYLIRKQRFKISFIGLLGFILFQIGKNINSPVSIFVMAIAAIVSFSSYAAAIRLTYSESMLLQPYNTIDIIYILINYVIYMFLAVISFIDILYSGLLVSIFFTPK